MGKDAENGQRYWSRNTRNKAQEKEFGNGYNIGIWIRIWKNG